ncbi:MAG: single-stranded-DNA-specific exonuclease RecJ [Anaerolineae bacterium]|nr:single-stranded-DNA-specific exonuclease RecJ [Anaerolineae bacterium]
MRNWIDPGLVEVPDDLRAFVGGHPLVAETLARRGVREVAAARAFLDPRYYAPASPYDLPDMARAVERLARGGRVCVWGDFDVDGQTATSLLVSALRALGRDVSYYIPSRLKESHGVHTPRLAELIDRGMDVLLTCDTGIAAHEAVDYAQSRGVDVVVTDHHALPDALPGAYAVVNPKRLPAEHPLYEMAGVGCAYKLVEALYAQAGRADEAGRFLDLVALGTVADVMVLCGDNRYMVQRGLDALRRTARLGLQAIFESAELVPDRLNENTIGFEIAPRLNALGRLDDANKAVELLTTGDPARARILASELEGLNAQRKQRTDQVYRAALDQIERNRALLDDAALVLAHPAWPAGIIGIVANRLADLYNRPVVLLAAPEGEPARGSARSVAGCDITAAIAQHRAMLHGFGGHQMAAGLSIDPARIDGFRRALARTVETMLGDAGARERLVIDGYVPFDALTLDFVEDLERLAPFGPGNPAFTLATRNVTIASERTVGRTGEHRRLVVTDEAGTAQAVMWWRSADAVLPEGRFDLAYQVRAGDFRGQRQVEATWVDACLSGERVVVVAAPARAEVVDYRTAAEPRAALMQLQAEGGIIIWAEVDRPAGGLPRDELAPAKRLAIWTAPPGPAELRAALDRVAPEAVYLFGVDPGVDEVGAFVRRLAGLVRYTLKEYAGQADLERLAAVTAHRVDTVCAGLEWLAARGDIRVVETARGAVHLAPGDGSARADLPQATARLHALAAETAAYRAYFMRAGANLLI